VTDKPDPEVRVVDRRWWARGDSDAAGDDGAARKPKYVEELEQQLAERTAQLQSYGAEQRRSLEELEQVRVRVRRDAAREGERARRTVLLELLEVLDNLDRAINAGTATSDSALLTGVQLVRDQFLAKLEGLGVKRVETLGLPFDAARHEAVSMAPVSDPAEEGLVVAVLKEGYAIGDDLLRPAAVVVGTLNG
jgi:molecular chaperone GrpE